VNQPMLACLEKPIAYLLAALALSAASAGAQTTARRETLPANPERRIVVSLPDRKLALLEGDRVVKIYNGEFRIAQRLENPTYYKPGVVIAPGKDNPLGPRWIGLDVKGFGMHGTNRPESIGKRASHGCIRMRNRDIEDLFARVNVGDRVSLVGERTEELARLFGGETETIVAKNEAQARQDHDRDLER